MNVTDSLWALAVARARATPDALFAIDEQARTCTFEALRSRAERVAAALATRGVEAGTPVSWILPTRIEAFVLMIALARIGAVQNPLLPSYRRREVEFCLRQTGARFLLHPGTFRGFDYRGLAGELVGAVPSLEAIEVATPLPEAAPDLLPPWRPHATGNEAPVRWIFYTSGTTSAPKGARHTDAAVLLSSRGLVRALDLAPGARTGVVFPVTHLGGANALTATLYSGSTQLVVEVFDPDKSVEFLSRHGVTHCGAGPVFYQAYLDVQRARRAAGRPEPIFPALRALYGGGAPTSAALHRAACEELGGLGILSTYGMTECPIITMACWDDPEQTRRSTEGRPTNDATRIRIVDPDGHDLPRGEEGEIRVHAPQCMAGYVDADLDREAFDELGGLRTGDLGRLDAAGYLQITGRRKDVIIRKGENISALEIETLLADHPEVAEVAVVGLRDATRGELACAVVRPRRPQAAPSLAALSDFLRERALMPQKIPERLEIVGELPRNPSGKVLKERLKARYQGS